VGGKGFDRGGVGKFQRGLQIVDDGVNGVGVVILRHKFL
jgi:hypothetical protein